MEQKNVPEVSVTFGVSVVGGVINPGHADEEFGVRVLGQGVVEPYLPALYRQNWIALRIHRQFAFGRQHPIAAGHAEYVDIP